MSDIKLLVIDVDGTMTDAGIYYDENGELRYGQVGYTYERYFGTIFYTDDKTN